MTNGAVIGYMILAARDLGMSEHDIRRLENSMRRQMDLKTEAEAKREYEKS
jgi:hypothetical protein